jgi:hypothetical protein
LYGQNAKTKFSIFLNFYSLFISIDVQAKHAGSYFNQFPSNFLTPYGKADSPQDDGTIRRRTNPISCEWSLRPKVAMSELAETVTENINVLKQDNLTLLETSRF